MLCLTVSTKVQESHIGCYSWEGSKVELLEKTKFLFGELINHRHEQVIKLAKNSLERINKEIPHERMLDDEYKYGTEITASDLNYAQEHSQKRVRQTKREGSDEGAPQCWALEEESSVTSSIQESKELIFSGSAKKRNTTEISTTTHQEDDSEKKRFKM